MIERVEMPWVKNEFPKVQFVEKVDFVTSGLIIDLQNFFTGGCGVRFFEDGKGDEEFYNHILLPAQKIRSHCVSFDSYYFSEFIKNKESVESFRAAKSSNLLSIEELLTSMKFFIEKQSINKIGYTYANKGHLIINGSANLFGSVLCGDGKIRDVYVTYCYEDYEWFPACADPNHWMDGPNWFMDFQWFNKI